MARNGYLRMIDTITQAYISLNEIEDEYDPELENRRAELFFGADEKHDAGIRSGNGKR